MRISKLEVVILAIAFVGYCMSAKLPKTVEKDSKKTELKKSKPIYSEKNKHIAHKDRPHASPKGNSRGKKTRDTNTKGAKKIWSAKSVIVQPKLSNTAPSRQYPMLDQLYEQRYHALEQVAQINQKINSIMGQNIQRNDYANAMASFQNPGSYNSYGNQAGSVAPNMENAQIRQLAIKMSKHYYNPENNAPLDIPAPLNDPKKSPILNATTDKLIGMDDHAVELGDPKEFDGACSVLKLTFEHTEGAMIFDDSPRGNNAELEDGAYVSDTGSKSGISAIIADDGYLKIPTAFKGKPKKATAISMWVKLRDIDGTNPLFQASDRNNTVHYDLSVVEGRPLWVHRNDNDKEIFQVKGDKEATFTAGKWHHLVGTYSSGAKKATLWLDGKEIGHQEGVTGQLSQDWTKVFIFEGKTAGFADNIFMFRCPLDRTKIIALYVSSASPKDAKRSSIPNPKLKKNKPLS